MVTCYGLLKVVSRGFGVQIFVVCENPSFIPCRFVNEKLKRQYMVLRVTPSESIV